VISAKIILIKTLNSDNAEIVIKIDGSASENYNTKPIEKIEPLTSKSIRATTVQRKETVLEFLRLKESKTEDYEILAIQFFYKKFHPAEFDVHEKLNNWYNAKITKDYIRKWVKSHFQGKLKQKNIELEKNELEKMKTKEEILKERDHKKELKAFLMKPMVTIEVTPEQKEQIISRLGENVDVLTCF
jgi:hypothetical protein